MFNNETTCYHGESPFKLASYFFCGMSMCVCVCEREREREGGKESALVSFEEATFNPGMKIISTRKIMPLPYLS